jgi:hypothetical protein
MTSSISPTESGSPDRPRRSRFLTFLIRAAFVCAVLVTLFIGWHVVEKIRGKVLWERYVAEAQSAGVKLKLEDFIPPAVPDAENFAAIPVFEETFRAQREGGNVPTPFTLPSPGSVKMPLMPDASSGRMLDLAAWQKYFVEVKLLPVPGDNPAKDVLEALKKYEPQMAQLREAGARPYCRFPVRWEDGVAAAMPHLSLFTGIVKIYSLRMGAHLALGEHEAAYEEFRGALRLFTATAHEPSLISCLVRATVLSSTENAVWNGLAQRQWTEAEMVRIEQDLAPLRVLGDYQFGMGSERGFSNLLFDQLQDMSAKKVVGLMAMVESADTASAGRFNWEASLFHLYPRGWIYRSAERSNRYFDQMASRVSMDPPRLFLDRAMEAGPQNISGMYDKMRHLFFVVMAPALGSVESRYGWLQVFTDQSRLGCTLERYRLARGVYPASLSELAPAFIDRLPADVVNGEPYRYHQTDDGGYVLYSVAVNLTDDGGETKGNSVAQKLDWVWKMPGK